MFNCIAYANDRVINEDSFPSWNEVAEWMAKAYKMAHADGSPYSLSIQVTDRPSKEVEDWSIIPE